MVTIPVSMYSTTATGNEMRKYSASKQSFGSELVSKLTRKAVVFEELKIPTLLSVGILGQESRIPQQVLKHYDTG